MPVYEYVCANCSQHFERKQSFAEESIRVCPMCGGVTRRVLFPVSIVFKGSGWYITDSRKADGAATIPAAESKTDAAVPAATKPAEPTANGKSESAKSASTAPAAKS